MNRSKLFTICCVMCLVFFLTGCMTNNAPGGWLPAAKETLRDTFGSWIVVDYRNDGNMERSSGELIACQDKMMYVLTGSGSVAVPLENIISATFAVYKNSSGILLLWTFGGTLSTLSHGFFLVITAPLWLVGGITASCIESYNGIIIFKGKDFSWEEIRKYSRFPQGLPDGLDLSELKPKPLK